MTPRRHNSNRQSAAADDAAADDDDDGGAVIRCDENESEIELSAALAATSRLLSSPKPGHLPPPHQYPRTPAATVNRHRGHLRYDTIRDAILTCAEKPTQVGLICRTEPTTKKWKKEKKTKK